MSIPIIILFVCLSVPFLFLFPFLVPFLTSFLAVMISMQNYLLQRLQNMVARIAGHAFMLYYQSLMDSIIAP